MFDVGFSEILLTSAIALIVLGPERLPKVARQVGNWMGRARAMARQLSEQLEREVSAEELLKQTTKTNSGNTISGNTIGNTIGTTAPSAETPYTPAAVAPPALEPSLPTIAAPPIAEAAAAADIPVPALAPEYTYGKDAASTTAAAMHAADPPLTSPHE